MPFTASEQRGLTAARLTLDGIPTTGDTEADILIASEARPNAFVTGAMSQFLDLLLSREQQWVNGMDPRDWPRAAQETDAAAGNGRWSRSALAYMAACSSARATMRVREYWMVLWTMADAGLVTAEPLPVGLQLAFPVGYPEWEGPWFAEMARPLRWPPRALFRDATAAELAARGKSRADVDAYLDVIGRLVRDGAFRRVNRWRTLGQQLRTMGLDATFAEMRADGWFATRGLSRDTLVQAGQMARAVLVDTFAAYGFDTPQHGLYVVAAYNDGAPEWAAVQAGLMLAVGAPPAVEDHPTTPPTNPPPGGSTGGPIVGQAGDGSTKPDTSGTVGGSTGTGSQTNPGGTTGGDTTNAPTKPTDPLDVPGGTLSGTSSLAGLPPVAWLALGLGALALYRSNS